MNIDPDCNAESILAGGLLEEAIASLDETVSVRPSVEMKLADGKSQEIRQGEGGYQR